MVELLVIILAGGSGGGSGGGSAGTGGAIGTVTANQGLILVTMYIIL